MLFKEDYEIIKTELDKLSSKIKDKDLPQNGLKDFRLFHKSLFSWCIMVEYEQGIYFKFKPEPSNDASYDKLLEVYEFIDIFNLHINAQDELENTIRILEDYINRINEKLKKELY